MLCEKTETTFQWPAAYSLCNTGLLCNVFHANVSVGLCVYECVSVTYVCQVTCNILMCMCHMSMCHMRVCHICVCHKRWSMREYVCVVGVALVNS